MNMNGIQKYDANSVKDTQFVAQGNSSMTYEIGQEVEGVISNVSDQISINFSGKEVKVPSSAVKDAKEGETRTFQIMDISKNGIVLKEVGSTKKQGDTIAKQGPWCTQVEVDASVVLNSDKSSEEEEDTDLEDISNKMSASDYEKLSQEGISLESYALERLERALERIKTQRNDKSVQLEQQIEQLDQNVETTKKLARSNVSNDQAVQQIIEQLMNYDMPVTQDNVLRMAKAMDMLGAVDRMSDSASSYLIKNELSPTIENIYKAVYSRESRVSQNQEEAYSQLQDAIKSVIENAGIEDKEAAQSAARWLLDSDLPITAENITYKMELDELPESLNLNTVTENVIKALQNGDRPETADILNSETADYERLIQSIDQIEETTITKAVIQQKKDQSILSIQSLIQIQENSENNVSLSNLSTDDELAAVTAKRQLEEIRLKLTYEASTTLSAKGIKIETEELSKVVDGLKDLENKYYQNLMSDVSTTGSTSDVSLLQETQDAVQNVKQSSALVLSQTFTSRHSISLADLSEVATSQARYQQAESTYEALMTAPRSDMGDSIQKAFANVDSQLEMLGLDVNQNNERAIRILGYNNMELSTENVVAMKAYDTKVNELLTNLTPSVTASMIKDHINPLNIPLDELNEVAYEYRSELGDTEEVKYSEFLVDLEANKEITAKERDAYIGIYRLLHQVEKSDGAAIGALAKSGKELTLNNLLTEVRTSRSGKMDVSINDESSIKTSTGYQNSITDSINSYYEELTEYNESVVRSINKNLSPESLMEVVNQQNMDINEIPLEQIKEAMQEKTESHTASHINDRLKEIQELAKESKEYTSFLGSYDEVDNIKNIEAAKYSVEHNATLYEEVSSRLHGEEKDKIKKDSEKLMDVLDSKENLQEEYRTFTEETADTLQSVIWSDDMKSEDVKDINVMYDVLRLNGNLAKKEYYNIPVTTKESVVNMNLTVIHNSEEKGQLRIQLPIEGIGNVTVQASIDHQELKGYITCDQADGILTLSSQQEDMVTKLEECGFRVTQFNYGPGNIQPEKFIFSTGNIYKEAQSNYDGATEVSTNELYVASKAIVEQLTKLA